MLRASAPGLEGSPVRFEAIAIAEDASILSYVSGGSQTTVVAQTLAEQLIVRAEDAYGNPVEGVPILFAVTSGDGSVLPDSVDTDVDGLAATDWTLGTTAGEQEVVATGVGVAGYPVQFVATAETDSPDTLEIVSGDNQAGVAGETLDDPFYVQVRDQYSNPVANVAVEFILTAGDGSLSVEEAVTDTDGMAFTELSLGSAGEYEATATAASLPSVTFHALACEAVYLTQLTATISSVQVEWTQNVNSGFTSYALYRSTTPGVTGASTLVRRHEESQNAEGDVRRHQVLLPVVCKSGGRNNVWHQRGLFNSRPPFRPRWDRVRYRV